MADKTVPPDESPPNERAPGEQISEEGSAEERLSGSLPELNRRRKENGIFAHIASTLVGKQSRKVAFGIWGFLAANTLISAGKIDMFIYWKIFLTCALLIGFGTILDEILSRLGDKITTIASAKINSIGLIVEQQETRSRGIMSHPKR